jgi:serine/threonine-protein kinase
VDAQTDIWAFGCVYEMLTGRPAFGRATLTDTMAAVIEREPDWTALPRSTPGSIVRLLRRTLEKNPGRRLHAIADARLDLEEAREPTMPPAAATSLRRSARSLMLGAAVVALVLPGRGAAAGATRRAGALADADTPVDCRLWAGDPSAVGRRLA